MASDVAFPWPAGGSSKSHKFHDIQTAPVVA